MASAKYKKVFSLYCVAACVAVCVFQVSCMTTWQEYSIWPQPNTRMRSLHIVSRLVLQCVCCKCLAGHYGGRPHQYSLSQLQEYVLFILCRGSCCGVLQGIVAKVLHMAT